MSLNHVSAHILLPPNTLQVKFPAASSPSPSTLARLDSHFLPWSQCHLQPLVEI